MKDAPHQHLLDSSLSYIGGGSMIALSFAEIATIAQQLGAIVGCIVVCIKLFYDIQRIIKSHRKKKP